MEVRVSVRSFETRARGFEPKAMRQPLEAGKTGKPSLLEPPEGSQP